MTATSSRIGFITSQFRNAVAETVEAKTLFGSLARTSADPVETFFDSETDAAVVAAARQTLLGQRRRRFRVTVNDAKTGLNLDFSTGSKVARYVDAERGADRQMIISDVSVDLGRDTATFTVWG